MIPPVRVNAASVVLNGALVHPFCRVSGVKSERVNEAPSREVKHWALENVPPSAWTPTEPLGWMTLRPFVLPQRLTGTYTLVPGRRPLGSVNATAVVPLEIAPLKRTIP